MENYVQNSNLFFNFFVTDINIKTNCKFPSISAHQVTLSLPKTKPLDLQFSWPVLAAGIESSLKIKEDNIQFERQ